MNVYRMGYAMLLAIVGSAALAQDEVKISTKGGLSVTAGDYSFKLGGRIQYDFNRSELNGEVDEDTFGLRRGRIFVSGDIGDDWSFKSQFNTNGDGVEDFYIKYKGWGKAANLIIGNQKVPFGLQEQVSSKDVSVLERSALIEQFAIGRADSVALHGVLPSSQSYAVSIFSQDIEDSNDDEIGFAARYTYAPIVTDRQIVHLGVAYRDVADTDAFGLEAAAVNGPFHIQAEYADGDFGADSLDGYYVQAGWVFTGEARPYSKGKFKRIKPERKFGAWEGVFRYEDGYGNYSDIELGRTEAKSYTIGLNWYAHKNVRIGINYTDGEDDLSNDDGNEFRVRFQLTF